MSAEIADLTPKARRTRSALLAAAMMEAGRQGVAGVTVMAVCDRARVGRTSFYNYFEDTDALMSTVAKEAAEGIKERFDRLHKDIPRGRDRLKACVGMIFATAVEDPDTILLVEALSHSEPEIMKLLETEITAELVAFAADQEEDPELLGQQLAVASIALARQLAQGGFPGKDIDRHVDFIMNTCR